MKPEESGQSIDCDDLNAKRMALLEQQVYHEFQKKKRNKIYINSEHVILFKWASRRHIVYKSYKLFL